MTWLSVDQPLRVRLNKPDFNIDWSCSLVMIKSKVASQRVADQPKPSKMTIADYWLSFSGKFLIPVSPDIEKYAVIAGEFEFGDVTHKPNEDGDLGESLVLL